MLSRRRRTVNQVRESGQAAVELIGFVVVAMIIGVVALQGVMLVQTHSAVQEAARHGARDFSEHGDWNQARGHIDNALPSWVENVQVDHARSAYSTRVEVSVEAPLGIPSMSIGSISVTRDAEFRTGG